MSYRRRTIDLLELANPSDKSGRIISGVLTALIAISVVEVMLESVTSIGQEYGTILQVIEYLTVGVFTVEYLLRLWSVTSIERYRHPVSGRIRFALTPLLLIDFLAILPAYLPLLLPYDLRILRVIRLFRVFRLFKLGRYVVGMRHIAKVFRQKGPELVTALSAAVVALIMSSTLIYYVEADAQPEVFTSIPKTLWWGVITLTTVGYGDMYPVTAWGRFFGGIVSVIGIGVLAVPAGIIASGLTEELTMKAKKCPHCGAEL